MRCMDGDTIEVDGAVVVIDLFEGLLADGPDSHELATHIAENDAWHGLFEVDGAVVLYTEPNQGPAVYYASSAEDGEQFEISSRFVAVLRAEDMSKFPDAVTDGSVVIDASGSVKSDWSGNIVGAVSIFTDEVEEQNQEDDVEE